MRWVINGGGPPYDSNMRSIDSVLEDLGTLVEELSAVAGGTNDVHHPEKLLEVTRD